MSKHYIVSDNLIPEGNGSYSIGSATNSFGNAFLSGTLSVIQSQTGSNTYAGIFKVRNGINRIPLIAEIGTSSIVPTGDYAIFSKISESSAGTSYLLYGINDNTSSITKLGTRMVLTGGTSNNSVGFRADVDGAASTDVAFQGILSGTSAVSKRGTSVDISGDITNNDRTTYFGFHATVDGADTNYGSYTTLTGTSSVVKYGYNTLVGGDLTSTKAKKWAFYGQVTGEAIENYGIQVNVSGASANYGIVVNRGSSIFNSTGDPSTDFRIEGDTRQHLFFVDSSVEKIGINNATPSYELDAIGTVSTTALRVTGGASSNYTLKSDATGNASWQEDVDTFGFTLQQTALALDDNKTYYGSKISAGINAATSSTFHNYRIAFTCSVIGFHVYNYNATNNATGETSSLWLRVNKTTDYLLTSTLSFAGTVPIAYEYYNNSFNLTLNEGDGVEWKLITPTFSVNPGNAGIFVDFFTKRIW